MILQSGEDLPLSDAFSTGIFVSYLLTPPPNDVAVGPSSSFIEAQIAPVIGLNIGTYFF